MRFADRPLEQAHTSTSSHRAIVEALSDWRHESSSAKTIGDSLRVHARSALAVARVASWFCFRQTGEALTSGWAVWMLAWIAAPLALNHYMLSRHDAPGYASAALADYGILMQTMSFCVFVALVTARSKSAAPVLGLIGVVLGIRMLVGMYGWPVVWSYMVRDDAEWWTRRFNGQVPSALWGWRAIVVGTILPAALILLGDRIRRDRRRLLFTIGFLGTWAVTYVAFVYGRSQVGLWGPELAVDHPVLLALWQAPRVLMNIPFILPASAVAAWLFMVRRQRRTDVIP